jgi:mono/diheme cytochrome c family protein
MKLVLGWMVLIAAGAGLAVAQGEEPAAVAPDHAERMAAGQELFKSQVRGLLVQHCLDCHGGKKVEGDFNLATREGLLKGGASGEPGVADKAADSWVMSLIRHAEEPAMPFEQDQLPDTAIDAIGRWIDLGAPYDKPLVEGEGALQGSAVVTAEDRQHWSYLPLATVTPPEVAGWHRNAVDRFVLAKLEEKALRPNPIANRRTLIRRASLDLIGLPPSAEEVEAFVADRDPAAYEKLIDRLLASGHYGERWGRHWLDLARFAESHGYEQDYDRPHAYHYRDFVIRALNDDMAYDRFVRLQIAGDELEPDNPQALLATGFLGAGTHATQITANQVEKERYDELDDMVNTTGTAFLGLTIGCARCHDHKFDPIPTSDYYHLLATFTTTVRSEIELDLEPERTRQAQAEFDAQHAPLVAAHAKYEADVLPGLLDAWLARGVAPARPTWMIVAPSALTSKGGATFTRQADGSYLASGTNSDTDEYRLEFSAALGPVTAIRIEALADGSLPKSGPGRADNGNFGLCDARLTIVPADASATATAVKLTRPRADFEQAGLPVAAAIDDDPKSCWAVDPEFGKNHVAAFDLEAPVTPVSGERLALALKFEANQRHSIGRLRVAISSAASSPALGAESGTLAETVEIERIVALPTAQRSAEDRQRLLSWFGPTDAEWRRLNEIVETHARLAPRPTLAKVMITSEGLPAIRFHTQGADFFEETYLLKRGDLSQKQGVATPAFLQVLTSAADAERHWQVAPPAGARTSHRRAALARWITDTEQGAGALAARVMANRLWQHHFGRGIVATPSDFGKQGERPTHPELLEWLAGELVRGGWRLKPLHKLMMTSAAYMQTVASDDARAATRRIGCSGGAIGSGWRPKRCATRCWPPAGDWTRRCLARARSTRRSDGGAFTSL